MTVQRLSRSIVSADTVEELLDYQSKQEAEANARITTWQAAIKKGDLLRYVFDHLPELSVYAEVKRARSGQPYVFVRAYSVFVPNGEMGDIHRSIVTEVITREAFETAQAQGWRAGSRSSM